MIFFNTVIPILMHCIKNFHLSKCAILHITSAFRDEKPEINQSEVTFHNDIRPQDYKTFSMLKSIEHEIFPTHNVKMPTIVGILTFMS